MVDIYKIYKGLCCTPKNKIKYIECQLQVKRKTELQVRLVPLFCIEAVQEHFR